MSSNMGRSSGFVMQTASPVALSIAKAAKNAPATPSSVPDANETLVCVS